MTGNQWKYDGQSEKENEDGSRVKHIIKAKAKRHVGRDREREGGGKRERKRKTYQTTVWDASDTNAHKHTNKTGSMGSSKINKHVCASVYENGAGK